MTQQIIDYLIGISRMMPIEVFVFLGAILEEIIAPIPCPFVMTTAALLLLERGAGIWKISEVLLIASLGKTFASFLIFVIADKFEDFFAGKYGKYFGLDHKKIEGYGKVISGNKWSWLVFGLLRSIPVVPFFPLSVVAGVVKMNMNVYLVTTFVGGLFRYAFYLALVFLGVDKIFSGIGIFGILSLAVVGVVGIFVFYKLKDMFQDHVVYKKHKEE